MALGKLLGVKEWVLLRINEKLVFNTAGSGESEEEEGIIQAGEASRGAEATLATLHSNVLSETCAVKGSACMGDRVPAPRVWEQGCSGPSQPHCP